MRQETSISFRLHDCDSQAIQGVASTGRVNSAKEGTGIRLIHRHICVSLIDAMPLPLLLLPPPAMMMTVVTLMVIIRVVLLMRGGAVAAVMVVYLR